MKWTLGMEKLDLFEMIENMLDDHPIILHIICGLCGLAAMVVFIFIKPIPWYATIGAVLGTAFMVPVAIMWSVAIIIYILKFLLFPFVWIYFLLFLDVRSKNHLKESVDKVTNYSFILIVMVAFCWLVSFGFLRLCASTIAIPNSQCWKEAYFTTSPDAYSYHHDINCKYLQQTKYTIMYTTVDHAESQGRKACEYCLHKNKKYQYDKYIVYVSIILSFCAIVVLWFCLKKRVKP